MMDWSLFHLDKLPYAQGRPEAMASLRAVPEDFCVDELPGFTPSGEGEHVFLHIRKRNQNTAWVAGLLARAAGLREDAVSYAGLKDRRAVTTQWFSVHIPNRVLPDFSSVWSDDIQCVQQTWNARKLKRGSHQGNRFSIVLRDVEGDHAELEQRLVHIRECGVPNYIGVQRFGHDYRNLSLGEAVLAGRPPRRLGHRESLGLSAVRSALFNKVLAARMSNATWQHYLPGDVLMLDGRGSFFQPDPHDAALAARLQALEIHPTGPLPGRGVPAVSGEVLALETAVLTPASECVQALEKFGVDAQRRALRLRVADLKWAWQNDTQLQLEFALSSGAFATSVLRELVQLRESVDAIPIE